MIDSICLQWSNLTQTIHVNQILVTSMASVKRPRGVGWLVFVQVCVKKSTNLFVVRMARFTVTSVC